MLPTHMTHAIVGRLMMAYSNYPVQYSTLSCSSGKRQLS